MGYRLLEPQALSLRVSDAAPHRQIASDPLPLTIWLTGLSGAGKTTLSDGVQRLLERAGIRALRIDGDQLRAGLCKDLGFSPEDRHENVRRAAQTARLLNDQGMLVLVSMISPTTFDRQTARAIIGADRFVEVYVRADVALCRARDPKGLYARVRRGEITEFTGISAPYEPPMAPTLTIDTTTSCTAECIDRLALLIQQCVRTGAASRQAEPIR